MWERWDGLAKGGNTWPKEDDQTQANPIEPTGEMQTITHSLEHAEPTKGVKAFLARVSTARRVAMAPPHACGCGGSEVIQAEPEACQLGHVRSGTWAASDRVFAARRATACTVASACVRCQEPTKELSTPGSDTFPCAAAGEHYARWFGTQRYAGRIVGRQPPSVPVTWRHASQHPG